MLPTLNEMAAKRPINRNLEIAHGALKRRVPSAERGSSLTMRTNPEGSCPGDMNVSGIPAALLLTPGQRLASLSWLVSEAVRDGRPSGTESRAATKVPVDSSASISDGYRTTKSHRVSEDGSGPPIEPPTGPPIEQDHAEMWALVRSAQSGDGEAFGKLYDHYVTAVFRFIYYRVNDRALAEDFTSETFLRALRRIATIDYQGRDIGAWFMTIARNIVFDHTKSARFRLELTTDDIIEPNESVDSPEIAVLTNLTNARLLAAVTELGEEQRECIVLRFLNGLSVSETAAVMGKNDGAIKALQHRAVKRLAGILGDDLR